jgi:CTD small phosphatase-like protein 2
MKWCLLGNSNSKKTNQNKVKIWFILDMKTVVFDLDETLIHCNDSLTPPHDVKLPIKFPTG